MSGRTTKRTAADIKLSSYDELFGETPVHADAVEVMIKELHDFQNHPFHVNDDEDMAELQSADSNGRFCGAKRTRCGASGLIYSF